jgi:hypothetical protein
MLAAWRCAAVNYNNLQGMQLTMVGLFELANSLTLMGQVGLQLSQSHGSTQVKELLEAHQPEAICRGEASGPARPGMERWVSPAWMDSSMWVHLGAWRSLALQYNPLLP